MTIIFTSRGQKYQVQDVAEDGGYNATIATVRIAQGRIVERQEWRRLDRPRPTANLAARDAHELAVTLLAIAAGEDRSASEDAAGDSPLSVPHVTADEIMARVRADGQPGIGDGLYTYLGEVAEPYKLGFIRGVEALAPPPEIDSALYRAGFDDGQAAYPLLLEARMLSANWRSRGSLRSPSPPTLEGTVLTDRDELAEYRVERMRVDIQPVYEPGTEEDTPEARQTRSRFYLNSTALLHERPLPRAWLRSPRPHAEQPISDLSLPARINARHHPSAVRLRPERRPAGARLVEGRLQLSVTYDRVQDESPEEWSDPTWVLEETRSIALSWIAALEERRRAEPEAFVLDPVTMNLQQRAAQLRKEAEHGPTQLDIDEEKIREWDTTGEQLANMRAWNEDIRRHYEERLAELPLLEARIRARAGDPNDAGGWEPFWERSRLEPAGGGPALGWEPVTPSGLSDELLLLEISRIVDENFPEEFDIRLSRPGIVEIRPHDPKPIEHETVYMNVITRTPKEYEQLTGLLASAARRWQVRPWAIPTHAEEPGSDFPQWTGPSRSRWHISMPRDPTIPNPSQPDSDIRQEYVYIEVQLAPQGSRAPADWEC